MRKRRVIQGRSLAQPHTLVICPTCQCSAVTSVVVAACLVVSCWPYGQGAATASRAQYCHSSPWPVRQMYCLQGQNYVLFSVVLLEGQNYVQFSTGLSVENQHI